MLRVLTKLNEAAWREGSIFLPWVRLLAPNGQSNLLPEETKERRYGRGGVWRDVVLCLSGGEVFLSNSALVEG